MMFNTTHETHPLFSSPPPVAPNSTREQLDRMHIPNYVRDACVDHFVMLHRCRPEEGLGPWACHHEKHMYEQCQWELFKDQQQNKHQRAPIIKEGGDDHKHH